MDAQGNIYIAARTENNSSIIKVTAAGVASELVSRHHACDQQSPRRSRGRDGKHLRRGLRRHRIVRLTTAGVASVLSISGLPAPSSLGARIFGVTLDPSGNLYIPDLDNNRIVFVNVSAAVLAFPSTNVGSTSGPQDSDRNQPRRPAAWFLPRLQPIRRTSPKTPGTKTCARSAHRVSRGRSATWRSSSRRKRREVSAPESWSPTTV